MQAPFQIKSEDSFDFISAFAGLELASQAVSLLMAALHKTQTRSNCLLEPKLLRRISLRLSEPNLPPG
ncbi:hypothetical protein PROAA_910016 [Candidatus Propionivibrio aalborgensis]|uniref:Uncharacterized protein n=1 Tax=Candidatus Propionivibrio aalborgensis TaxID=1860101 RepID=A0A1A8Y1Z1_9RHOO|nr:hypothetical protein PROAA_910016 [Candidatus Propionivibrio aalborgensis]